MPLSPTEERTRLVGRDAEMTRFADLLDARRGVLLHGAAGSGKTRLAEELLIRAEAAGAVGRFVRAAAAISDVPLAPFAELLPGGIDAVQGVSLVVAARNAIAALGADRTVVLAVDDVHLLDEASAAVVNQLVTGGAVVLLATMRDGEHAPRAVSELWRRGLVERWQVDALGAVEASELAADLLDEPLAADLADDLFRLTGGSPLHIAALARAMNDSAAGDRFDLAASSSTLAGFVDQRLAALSVDQRDALAVVALAEPIGAGVLERFVDGDALVHLERQGWLTVAESGRRVEVRLAHPMYGEVLRRTISPLFAHSVHRELVAAVQGFGARRREDLLRVAAWSLDGDAPVPATQQVRAAEQALAAGDFALAERLAESVWDAGADFGAGHLLLFLHHARRYQEQPDAFLAELHRVAGGDEQRAQLAATQAFETLWRTPDLARTLELLEQPLAELTDPDARDELGAHRASVLATCGQVAAARELIESLRSSPSMRVQITSALAERVLETVFGDPRPLIVGLDQLEAMTAGVEDQLALMPIRMVNASMARALVQQGQGERAEQLARAAVDAGGGNPRNAGTLEFLLAETLIWRGRPVEALAWAQRSLAVQRRFGYATLVRWSCGAAGLAAALAGDRTAAEAALDEADGLLPNPAIVWDGDHWQARAVLAATAGDAAGAVAWARRGIDMSRSAGAGFGEAVGWHLLASCGDATVATEAAAALEPLAARLGGLVDLFAAHAAGLGAGDGAALLQAADGFAAAGSDGIAATTATAAARLLDAAGDARGATRAAQLARRLRGQEGASPTPAPEVETLSRREREVAALAAGAATSKEIAATLFVSARTVDNHLANVYRKLGISGRGDLPAALARLDGSEDLR